LKRHTETWATNIEKAYLFINNKPAKLQLELTN